MLVLADRLKMTMGLDLYFLVRNFLLGDVDRNNP